MEELLRAQMAETDWPEAAERMYERVEVLGRGSFGVVWMARRIMAPMDNEDDEYVAIKNIEIKEDKSRVYAQREISILSELRHPNIIRLIRSFPIYQNRCQLVCMQMARGPNLQYLVSKRGALGLPLSRLVARHLIAAVSYLHGRAVIHRDIKPTNCILENTELATQDIYDWVGDDMIWSDSKEAQKIVASGKFKLMLVDFGFARALDDDEVVRAPKRMRNSIIHEVNRISLEDIAKLIEDEEKVEEAASDLRKSAVDEGLLPQDVEDFPLNEEEEAAIRAAGEATVQTIEHDTPSFGRRRQSNISMGIPFEDGNRPGLPSAKVPSLRKMTSRRRGRQSTTRAKVRAMSALGTKAYAAPEIKHQLRNKTDADFDRSLVALTECVADYGMIVDAYSVGWTLRVIMTGIPPNVTISQYMRKVNASKQEVVESGCLCMKSHQAARREINVRDTSEIPKDATLLITMMTKSNPEDRITVREAQEHPYIRGGPDETPYVLPSGDVPSKCGDPVVPLKCARELADFQKDRM